MPPLDVLAPVLPATEAGRARPVHPSPMIDGLRLEVLSPREIAWWGRRFGIDTPYVMVPTGWGEWVPLFGI